MRFRPTEKKEWNWHSKGFQFFALCAKLHFKNKVLSFALLFLTKSTFALFCSFTWWNLCRDVKQKYHILRYLTTESSSHWLHNNHKQRITNKRLFFPQVSETPSSLPTLLLNSFFKNHISPYCQFQRLHGRFTEQWQQKNWACAPRQLQWVIRVRRNKLRYRDMGRSSQTCALFAPWSWYHHSLVFQLCSLLVL